MPKANERIRRQSEQEREAGLPKNNITNKQKTLIKQLMKERWWPNTAYYQAVYKLVQQPKTIEHMLKLKSGLYSVTSHEASGIINELLEYPKNGEKK